MSYINLPNYLKPCFLYMGVFKEDQTFRVSTVRKVWVSEGFLKPMSGKSLETIAQECFEELAARNLIIVDKLGFRGNVKFCKIHDLLRDLCLKEVGKMRFYRVIEDTHLAVNSERHVVFQNGGSRIISEVMVSLSHARSIIYEEYREEVTMQLHNLRFLRILKTYDKDTYQTSYSNRHGVHLLDDLFQLVNSRHLAVRAHWRSKIPASIVLLWNLNTLTVHQYEFDKQWVTNRCTIDRSFHYLIAPIEIWKLHQLRYLEFAGAGFILPDPPRSNDEIVIMENLQTLRGALYLYLNEEVVKRIPNVKKLCLSYWEMQMEGCLSYLECLSKLKRKDGENCLSYLECLSKLENLQCIFDESYVNLEKIRFPHSLKKLNLKFYTDIELEEILQKIGLLPLLQKLLIRGGSFKTGKWETIEGQFRKLKILALDGCRGLENWAMAESSHFPVLHELRLERLRELEEIPSEVGEILTLKSISLVYCSESAVVSAKKIVEEQEDLYGDQVDLRVRALVWKEDEALQSLASANFEVITELVS